MDTRVGHGTNLNDIEACAAVDEARQLWTGREAQQNSRHMSISSKNAQSPLESPPIRSSPLSAYLDGDDILLPSSLVDLDQSSGTGDGTIEDNISSGDQSQNTARLRQDRSIHAQSAKAGIQQSPRPHRLVDRLRDQRSHQNGKHVQHTELHPGDATFPTRQHKSRRARGDLSPPVFLQNKPKSKEQRFSGTTPPREAIKPRVTYASQRSYVENAQSAFPQSPPTASILPTSSRRVLHTDPYPRADQSSVFDVDIVDDSQTNLQSLRNIHALRKAGNVTRLANQMDALVDEAHKGSLYDRRPRLLRLVSQLKDSTFREVFTSKGLYTVIFGSISNRPDTLVDILTAVAAVQMLQESVPPSFLHVLSGQPFLALLGRLLSLRTTIDYDSVHNAIDITGINQVELDRILRSDRLITSWNCGVPRSITGRTLSLQILDQLARGPGQDSTVQIRLPDSIIDELWTGLSALENASTLVLGDVLEVHLCLSILQKCKVGILCSQERRIWAAKLISSILDLLRPNGLLTVDQVQVLRVPALAIALDITQNDPEACTSIASPGTIRTCASFVLSSLGPNSYLTSSACCSEEIILNLGLLVNLADASAPARRHFLQKSEGNVPIVDGLLFVLQAGMRETIKASCLYDPTP